MKPFQEAQLAFTEYLRSVEPHGNTDDNKPRTQEIYRDFVYKNINHCIADVLPITKSIISESEWKLMICEFIGVHRLQTPYFLEICQEFLVYLANTRQPFPTDYPFMQELAHFEWIQLALDISEINFPEHQHDSAPTENSLWKTSPLLVGLTYSYPVHLIDECYLPKQSSAHPTHLLVYRDRKDDVKILVTDSLSLRIIQLLQAHENINYSKIFQLLSEELDSYHEEMLLPKVLSAMNTLTENELILCS